MYQEGTHIMIPGIEWPIIYDVRARPHLVESTSGSRDLQMVSFTPHRVFLSFAKGMCYSAPLSVAPCEPTVCQW